MMFSHFRRLAFLLACLLLGAAAIRRETGRLAATPQRANRTTVALAEQSPTPAPDYFQRLLARMKADPITVAITLQAAVRGVGSAVDAFKASPPEYEEGFAQIRLQMWEVIEWLAEEDFKSTQQYADAHKAWEAGFRALPDLTKDAVDRFQRDGDLIAFKEVVDTAVNTSEAIAAASFPALSTTFEAYGSLMRGVSSAWVSYADGDTEVAIDTVWTAFNTSIRIMVGPDRAADASFQEVMQSLDSVVSTLLTNIVEFKKAKIESNICYRQMQMRSSRNPTFCDNNQDWDYDGQSTCYPKPHNGADCSDSCRHHLSGSCPFCPVSKPWCCKSRSADTSPGCEFADYVDHSYTYGTAADYHQCVSPGFPALAEVGADQKPRVLAEKPSVLEDKPVVLMIADEKEQLVAKQEAALLQGRSGGKTNSSAHWSCWMFFWRRACHIASAQPPGGGRSLFGSHPARCDAASDHALRIGDLCYSSCPQQYSPVIDEGEETPECQQQCRSPLGKEGEFGQSMLTWSVCANTTSLITDANRQILLLTRNTISTVREAVSAISQRKGIDVSLINRLIDAFGSLAAHFNRPQCNFGTG